MIYSKIHMDPLIVRVANDDDVESGVRSVLSLSV